MEKLKKKFGLERTAIGRGGGMPNQMPQEKVRTKEKKSQD